MFTSIRLSSELGEATMGLLPFQCSLPDKKTHRSAVVRYLLKNITPGWGVLHWVKHFTAVITNQLVRSLRIQRNSHIAHRFYCKGFECFQLQSVIQWWTADLSLQRSFHRLIPVNLICCLSLNWCIVFSIMLFLTFNLLVLKKISIYGFHHAWGSGTTKLIICLCWIFHKGIYLIAYQQDHWLLCRHTSGIWRTLFTLPMTEYFIQKCPSACIHCGLFWCVSLQHSETGHTLEQYLSQESHNT